MHGMHKAQAGPPVPPSFVGAGLALPKAAMPQEQVKSQSAKVKKAKVKTCYVCASPDQELIPMLSSARC
jgi:invasion protein IalB